jgi:hypothetical protein
MNLGGPLRVCTCSRGQHLWTTTGGWNGEDGAGEEYLLYSVHCTVTQYSAL